ncbi:unnamed protein product [Brassica oleracea]
MSIQLFFLRTYELKYLNVGLYVIYQQASYHQSCDLI